MGCGLSINQCNVQSSTVVELFDENQAKNLTGVSVIKFTHQGKQQKLYYKQLTTCHRK